ncbi:hypothetical protein IJ579_01450 [bacterium]|nr:hypothetical protein [bacterium]
MGLSSNARLLSLTARITSNEYEAQKISNARMRLSNQSQEVSRDYINALNSQKLVFMSYDAYGNSTTSDLTAGLLYQYGASKSQYVLANTAGQALIKNEDHTNYSKAENLDEFLASYGITKSWRTETLSEMDALLKSKEYQDYKDCWEAARYSVMSGYFGNGEFESTIFGGNTVNVKNIDCTYTDEFGETQEYAGGAEDAWMYENAGSYNDYALKYNEYSEKLNELLSMDHQNKTSGVKDEAYEKLKEDVGILYDEQNELFAKYSDYVTFDAWVNMKARDFFPELFEKYLIYDRAAAKFNAEIEKFDTLNDTYTYSDPSKAQWYTNLWYRLNGESTEKNEVTGLNSTYVVLDDNLLSSSSWIQDALAQGAISIEAAKYIEETNQIPDSSEPNVMNLKGISWDKKIYSNCTDITTSEDKTAIARAEAEYEAKTKEISDKDKKYENKMKVLETERQALEEEYNAAKKVLFDNIKRSYNVFNS